MDKYYIKHNQNKAGLCPWELWLGESRIDCFVSEKTAQERCDLMNYTLEIKSKFKC